MSTFKFRTAVLTTSLAAMIVLLPNEKPAQAGTMEQAITRIAKEMKGFLERKSVDKVAVGKFSGPRAAGNNGLQMTEMLGKKLKKLGISSAGLNGMEVRGRYITKAVNDKTEVRVIAELYDADGGQVNEWNALFIKAFGKEGAPVTDPSDVVSSSKISTVDTTKPDPAQDSSQQTQPKERAKTITDAIQNPDVHIENGIVSPRKDSLFALEILRKSPPKDTNAPPKYDTIPVTADSGYAFVDLQQGEVFAIRLINNAPYDVAVKLTLDGLNCFEFSEVAAYRERGMWVIMSPNRPGSSGRGLITGWHRDRASADEFLVTDLPNGAAAKLGKDKGSIGVIQAQFFAAWPIDEPKPNVEVASKRGSAGKAIGRGKRTGQGQVSVVRNFGTSLLAAVSIRYVQPEQLPVDLPQEGPPAK